MVVSRRELDERQKKLSAEEQEILEKVEKIIDEAIEREYISGKTKVIRIMFDSLLRERGRVLEELKRRYKPNGWSVSITRGVWSANCWIRIDILI